MAEGDHQGGGVKSTKHGVVMVGELPVGFLQVPSTSQDQIARDQQIAQQLAAQQVQTVMRQPVAVADRLFVSVVEAKLHKNYGIVKMDPYCRLRIGHSVYETETAYGGAKNPHWTKSISLPYSPELQTIYLEIFDERSMSTDCRIAWTNINLPGGVRNNDAVDDWWPLSGKLGEQQEGTIHLLITKKKIQQTVNPGLPVMYPGAAYPSPQLGVPMGTNPYYAQDFYPAGATQQPGPTPVQTGPMFTDQDVKQIKELFPNVEDTVIKAVLEASRGNKDAAINSLLQMQ